MKIAKLSVISIISLIAMWLLSFGYHLLLNLSDEDSFIGFISKVLSFSWVPGTGELGFSIIPLGIIGCLSYLIIKENIKFYSKDWLKYLFIGVVILFFGYEAIFNVFVNSKIEGYYIFYRRLGFIQIVVVLSSIATLININRSANVN